MDLAGNLFMSRTQGGFDARYKAGKKGVRKKAKNKENQIKIKKRATGLRTAGMGFGVSIRHCWSWNFVRSHENRFEIAFHSPIYLCINVAHLMKPWFSFFQGLPW